MYEVPGTAINMYEILLGRRFTLLAPGITWNIRVCVCF